MTLHKTPLEAKVAAFNRAHAEANRLAPLIVAALEPFHGTKIELASGGFTKKVKAILPELPSYCDGDRDVSAILSSSVYSVKLDIRVTAYYPEPSAIATKTTYSRTVTVEVTVYIADMHNGILGDFKNGARDPKLRTDYTVAEIALKFKAVDDADQALSDAKSALYPF